MTITDELIEQVARHMCEAMKMNPDECRTIGDGYYPLWEKYEQSAREAIAAHIALAEIMPPDRAKLLAVAGALRAKAGEAGND